MYMGIISDYIETQSYANEDYGLIKYLKQCPQQDELFKGLTDYRFWMYNNLI